MRKFGLGLIAALCCSTAATATVVLDGSASDPIYGTELAVQDTGTGFGDSTLGRRDVAGGSEISALYGVISNGNLYLVFAGNLETNGNDLEIFIDSRAGGQNTLIEGGAGAMMNPNVPGLVRMGALGGDPGLTLPPGFNADFYISVQNEGDPVLISAEYGELFDAAAAPNPIGGSLGSGPSLCDARADENVEPGDLADGDAGLPVIRVTVDNSNVDGVSGTPGVEFPSIIPLTGVELEIPLSAIGNPAGSVDVFAFINGAQHDFVSNQTIGGLFGAANLGEPRVLDFGTTLASGITVPTSDAVGSCCVGGGCTITTQAGCGGTWTEGQSCDGNPCDAVPQGACCFDDTSAGSCEILTEGDCLQADGAYQGDNTNCIDDCPCQLEPLGACCDGTTCVELREVDCLALPGSPAFLGDFTTCPLAPEENPCLTGACCVDGTCNELRQEECEGQAGVYFGDDTVCEPDTCNTGACCLDKYCFVIAESDCIDLGGAYEGDFTDCPNQTCGTPADLPIVDGQLDSLYGAALAIQDTQTQFGDSNTGAVDLNNGSELNAAYGIVAAGNLCLMFPGNLESNFNKLEVFIDSLPGEGQNTLLEGVNPTVDFDALGRMGASTSTGDPGLTFDAGFEADYWFAVSGGNDPSFLFPNFAQLQTTTNPTPIGEFLGRADYADGGPQAGLPLPFADSAVPPSQIILVTVDNSNVAGVLGGTALVSDDPADGENPEAVTTGIELCIPLSAIGNPQGDIKVTAFVNGGGHDFLSNQVIPGIGGGENLGEPRQVDFSAIPGDQCFTVTQGPALIPGDSNCDGLINTGDIDAFVQAILNGEAGWAAFLGGSPSCSFFNNDANGDGFVDTGDIDPFVAILLGS